MKSKCLSWVEVQGKVMQLPTVKANVKNRGWGEWVSVEDLRAFFREEIDNEN